MNFDVAVFDNNNPVNAAVISVPPNTKPPEQSMPQNVPIMVSFQDDKDWLKTPIENRIKHRRYRHILIAGCPIIFVWVPYVIAMAVAFVIGLHRRFDSLQLMMCRTDCITIPGTQEFIQATSTTSMRDGKARIAATVAAAVKKAVAVAGGNNEL